jgi:hypothetical protein
MQRDTDRALANLQRRLERQFFEGCRLDAATKNWVTRVYQSVADVVGDSVAVTASFDVISALNAGAVPVPRPSFSSPSCFLRPSDLQELRDSMIAPLAAHASKQKAKSCSGVESDGAVSSSSSEGEEDADNTAAALWLENLLPLPLACSIVSSVLPFPQSMNSRVLTASPTAECNAVLGYVQVLHTRSTPSHTTASHS